MPGRQFKQKDNVEKRPRPSCAVVSGVSSSPYMNAVGLVRDKLCVSDRGDVSNRSVLFAIGRVEQERQ